MRRPIIAGNWKMYKTIGEALSFVQAFKPLIVASTHCDIVVAPVFTALKPVSDRLEGSNVKTAAQNVAAEAGPGPFTGEVSASMARDAGARYAIIGHSERRQYYGETDASINKKAGCVIAAGLIPIVCVGEHLEKREAGEAEAVVRGQLQAGLANLTPEQASLIMIAYEPCWAIGTGQTATPDVAQEMHAFIRQITGGMFGLEIAGETRILYGGSVKPDNISTLMNQADIDGALVGGASLEPEAFASIVNFK